MLSPGSTTVRIGSVDIDRSISFGSFRNRICTAISSIAAAISGTMVTVPKTRVSGTDPISTTHAGQLTTRCSASVRA